MKKHILILFFVIYCISSGYSQAIPKGDSLGLPGDNLNLYAVLDLFQKSETFEVFEKKLNDPDAKVNNLDLNNDGKTDYIKVIDHQQGDAHTVVLQDPVSEKENQDIAVIEIEKDKNGKVKVQIVGNEDLYGKDYIVEPKENDPDAKDASVNAPKPADTTNGKTTVINNTTNNYYDNTPYVAVDYWPMIHYMYTPGYVIYVSPWYWSYYPFWWHPWTPWFWHNYYWHNYGHYYHYHGWYHRTDMYRNPVAHGYYGPRRASSTMVHNYREQGSYAHTYNGRSVQGRKDNGGNNPVYKPRSANNAGNGRQQQQNNNNRSNNNNKPSRQPNTNRSGGNQQMPRTPAPRSGGSVPQSRGGGSSGGGRSSGGGGGGRSSGGGGGHSSGGGGHGGGGGRHK
ncbi:MAG: hypothetical protein ACXVPU_16075 [Bacteroidia bacterium]